MCVHLKQVHCAGKTGETGAVHLIWAEELGGSGVEEGEGRLARAGQTAGHLKVDKIQTNKYLKSFTCGRFKDPQIIVTKFKTLNLVQVGEVRVVAGQSKLASSHQIINLVMFNHYDGEDDNHGHDHDHDDYDHLAVTEHWVASNSELGPTRCGRWS